MSRSFEEKFIGKDLIENCSVCIIFQPESCVYAQELIHGHDHDSSW